MTVLQSTPAVLDLTVGSTTSVPAKPVSSERSSGSDSSHRSTCSASLDRWTPGGVAPINQHLSSTQRSQLQTLLDQFADVFAQTSDDLGRSHVATHRIDTGNHPPVNVPPYSLPPASREEVERQIQSMLRNGVVRESRSPWASPVVLVDKRDGTKRFCVDYRKVNACTKKDRYPIPRVDDSLDILSGKQYFTTLDLMSGYWQIPVASDDIEKTAFTTPASWPF